MAAVVARVPMPYVALFLNSGWLIRGSGEAGLLSWWQWRSPDQVRTVGHGAMVEARHGRRRG